MWPSGTASGGAGNPIWGGGPTPDEKPNPEPNWFGPNSGGGSNPSAGGWFGPNSGGGSNPSAGGWFGPNSGGGSNPSAGSWFGPTPGGGINPGPGVPGSNAGGGSHPATPSSRISQNTPCFLDLPHGVYDKLLLTISGRIKAHAKKFTVDLCTSNDIAFHFNPRFNDCGDRNVVIRNSCRAKKWDREERELSHFPFSTNTNFEMKILCTNSEYKVAVNGSHLLTFKHRIPNLRDVKKVCIYYDVENLSIKAETLP